MLCPRASVSRRFTGPAVPSTCGWGRSSTCTTTKRSIPENATLQHNRSENYRTGVSLSTSKARLLMVTGSRGMAIREFEIPIILVTHITKFN